MIIENLLKEQHYPVKDIKYIIKKFSFKDNYVIVYLDSEKIKVSLDDFVEYSLSSLKGLDENLYCILKTNEIYLIAYQGCLRKLAVKDNTVKQIRTFLGKYDLSQEQTNRIINTLQDKGYLNDEKYCINHILYMENSLLSYKQIRQKLMKDGISTFYIDKYLIEVSQKDKALALVKKYNKTINNKSLKNKKDLIKNKLMAQGFSIQDINFALGEIVIKQDNENVLLMKEYQKAKTKYEKKYSSYDLRNRIQQSLVMKGFNYEDIKAVINEDELV